jgi:RNA polymerase sigma-70 factor (ECF subfamily)
MEPVNLDDEALERVEALADSQTSARIVRELLGRLPEEQREAVRLHVIDEEPYDEIASRLKCSNDVIRQRVSRGLRALRVGLTEEAK